jgi:hypothetical protein
MHEDEERAKQMLARLNAAQPVEEAPGSEWEPLAIVVEGFVLRLP